MNNSKLHVNFLQFLYIIQSYFKYFTWQVTRTVPRIKKILEFKLKTIFIFTVFFASNMMVEETLRRQFANISNSNFWNVKRSEPFRV